ncbi:MAG: patatin-like phospholipase family protein [Chthoniobacterales bacterium]|nr:patatin-like phospholipase family protein [Chthoniobacterales bacterium]
MRLPDISALTSWLTRIPLLPIIPFAILLALLWVYGNFHQRPVASPQRQVSELPAIRPRDPGQYIRVLSIDGGGMRGLLALRCLEYLEKRSGKPVCELFDVMVGTSSGAFIVAALAMPLDQNTPRYTAAELLKEFPRLWGRTLEAPATHRILSLKGRTAPRFLTSTRQKVFQEFFGEAQLGAALTTIILPAYATREQVPFLFASDMGKSTSFSGVSGRAITEAGDFFLADAVTAATGNPAVSAPSKITNISNDQTEILIGAEVYANNPAVLALSEALLRYPGRQCVLISLGAGIPASGSTSATSGWRQTGNAAEILQVAAEASMLTTTQIASSLHRFGSGPVAAYIRLDIPLPADAPSADDGSHKNAEVLDALGIKLTSDKAATLDRTADFLGAKQ